MWADNEADLDLLGFEFLVDGLVVALTEPRLLPLTVGVLGDWGSGKSSLMRIAAKELASVTPHESERPEKKQNSRYLTVEFSPWQYEDHDDVKIALMSAVLDEIAKRAPGTASQVGLLRGILMGLRRWSRRLGRIGAAAAPGAVPVIFNAYAPELDDSTVELAVMATKVAAQQVEGALKEPHDDTGDAPVPPPTPQGEVDAFRREFKLLVDQIPDCDAIIVFIDDLDRCLPETVVDTFEAIRLFLNTPKTAYVLALNQNVVESAIDSRYPELKKPDGAGIGRDYLEKMLQLKVAVPPLSAPEAETYVNLLFAELHLPAQDFEKVLEHATELRRQNGLEVAFNTGIAGEILGNIPVGLATDLRWAAEISPILGASLRGNPRQLKRFLNNLLLKYRSAKRRDAPIELPYLAKLMVLEDQFQTDFQKLFDWEMAAGGACPEIATAEAQARGDDSKLRREPKIAGEKPATAKRGKEVPTEVWADGQPSDAASWAGKPHIADWLRVDPSFVGTDLRPYFTYSRDKLSFGVSASRLAPHLQQLMVGVLSEIDRNRRNHYSKVEALLASERMQFVEALLERVQRNPTSVALTAALELAEKNSDIVETVCTVLMRLPPASIPMSAGSAAARRLPLQNSSVAALLKRWEDGDNKPLNNAIGTARRAVERREGAASGNVG